MTRTASTRGADGSALSRFFCGRIYPLLVAILVLVGYVLEAELYTNIILLLSVALSLVVTGSVKPIIMPLVVYVYQIPVAHGPGYPEFSDYYSAPVRLAVIIVMFVIVLASLIYAVAAKGLLRRRGVYRVPFIFSSILLSVAFLMNGAFSGEHTLSGLAYGAFQIIAFFLVFYIFYFGFSDERCGDLIGYLVYCAAIIALLLFAETLIVYSRQDVISEGGIAIKDRISYGWGTCNNAGQCMTVLLPLLFLGAARSRHFFWVYILIAGIDLFGVLLTLSRSSILLSVFAVFVSAIMLCFFGSRRGLFRAATVIVLLALVGLGVVYSEELLTLFKDLIERGFTDNSRFALWRNAFKEFTEAPLFGKGFFSLDEVSNMSGEFLPSMAHNTFFQLIGSMGLFGLVAYLVYRIATVRVFLRHPSFEKSMLGLSVLTLLGQSLLDNFIFYFHPMFMYGIILAIAAKMTDETDMIYELYT